MGVNMTGGFVRQKGLNWICEKSMLPISLTSRSSSQSSLHLRYFRNIAKASRSWSLFSFKVKMTKKPFEMLTHYLCPEINLNVSGLNRKIGYEKPWNRKELDEELVLKQLWHSCQKVIMTVSRQGILAAQTFTLLPTQKGTLQEGVPKGEISTLTKQPLFTLML